MPSSGVQTSALDRKSTRLNSSHGSNSYAAFCLKKNTSYIMHQHLVAACVASSSLLVRLEKVHSPQIVCQAKLLLGRILAVGIEFFFFNDTATTEIYTLSLHDALPIYVTGAAAPELVVMRRMRHAVCI